MSLQGLFIPAVTMHEKPDKTYDVVDGKQRLTTLYAFYKGKFPDTDKDFVLEGLDDLKSLNGKKYTDLAPRVGLGRWDWGHCTC